MTSHKFFEQFLKDNSLDLEGENDTHFYRIPLFRNKYSF